MGKFIDMTGWIMREHGAPESRLTVIERTDDYISPKGVHSTRWKCLCECGNEVFVTRDQLVRKDGTKSCGCLHKEKAHDLHFIDLKDKVFDRLTVIEQVAPPDHLTYKRGTFWKCKCECGNMTIVRRDALVNKKTRSCGCIHNEASAERLRTMFTKDYRKYDSNNNLLQKFCPTCHRWLNPENFSLSKQSIDGFAYECKECKAHLLAHRYKMYITGAKNRNIQFNLSLDEFDSITKQPCHYCGQYSGHYLNTPFCGVDRIDSNKDYAMNNCVPCCETCNMMKSNLPVESWINHMALILNHYNQTVGDSNVQ